MNAAPQIERKTQPPKGVVRFDLAGKLGKFERTSSGGLVIPAYIARTGILSYTGEDGGLTREYRSDAEVSAEASWRSFEGVPVTVDHLPNGELITPLTWRQNAVGTVRNVRPDGGRIAADLVIEDAGTIGAIERGELVETSAGYRADLADAPGVVDGQAYDIEQRNIRGNHVALGPAGWGRSGPSVALRLDAITAPAKGVTRMDSMTTKTIKVDGIPYEAGSESHLQAVDKLLERKDAELVQARERFDGETKKIKAELDEAKGAKTALESRATKAETDAGELKKRLDAAMSPDEMDKRVESRLALIDRARGALGAKFSGRSADGKTSMADGEIMRACLDKMGVTLDAEDAKNDAIVRGAFLAATAPRGDADGEGGDTEDPPADETPPKGDRRDGGVRVRTVDEDDKPRTKLSRLDQVRADNAKYLENAQEGFAVRAKRS